MKKLNRPRYFVFVRVPLLKTVILFFIFLLATPASETLADYYKKIEPDGTIVFTNIPTTSGYTMIFDEYEEEYVTYQEYYYSTSAYDRIIKDASELYGIKPSLIKAVIKTESNFNPNAVSKKGACGLMQLIPSTAERFGVGDIFDPRSNIYGGTKYLNYLMDFFKGDLSLVLAAYNAGENAVVKYNNKIPPYKETKNYVKKVLKFLDYFSDRPLDL
jgi:soluble lytic murein transglycosylase-like protein